MTLSDPRHLDHALVPAGYQPGRPGFLASTIRRPTDDYVVGADNRQHHAPAVAVDFDPLTLDDRAAAVAEFIAERCDLHAGGDVAKPVLRRAWERWAVARGLNPGSPAGFTRALRVAAPTVDCDRAWTRQGRFYGGITLRAEQVAA